MDFCCFSLFLDFSKNLLKKLVKNWVTTRLIVYLIWEERNKRIFESSCISMKSLFQKFQVMFFTVFTFMKRIIIFLILANMRLLLGLCSIIFDELNHVCMVDNSSLLVSALLAGFCLVLGCSAESAVSVFVGGWFRNGLASLFFLICCCGWIFWLCMALLLVNFNTYSSYRFLS